jgi:hypothetical protein
MTARRWALAVAAALSLGFVGLHLAGARVCVGLLSGTVPGGEADVIAGVLYVVAWFGFVIGAPILVIAVLLDVACAIIATRFERWRAMGRR